MVKPTPSALPFVEHWRRAVLASNLSLATKVVAFGLAIHMNGDGTSSRAGAARLGRETRVDRRTIMRGRLDLLEAGFVEVVHKGGTPSGALSTPNEYRAILPPTQWRGTTSGEGPLVTTMRATSDNHAPTQWRDATQVRQESKATEEEGESSKFCEHCDNGWIEQDNGNFQRCTCIGGPIHIPNPPDPVDILAAIDDIAPPLPTAPPPELLPRARHAYPSDHEPF